jgi:DNA-binding beta-propeller fold protein YncE
MRFKGVLVIAFLALLCIPVTQSFAETFTLVKSIDLSPLVGDDGSIEVDVVGNQLYVANWKQDKYFRIDPITEKLLGSFSLGNGILIDNHGSEYDPTRGLLIHASDSRDWHHDPPGYDAFFMTDTNGNLVSGPYKLFGQEVSKNPEGLTVDPLSGRIWVSTVTTNDGIFEINPNDGTILNHIDIGGSAWALGFNPNTGKLFFADYYGVIWEIATDGTGLAKVFDPSVGPIFGMAFTPSGDLVLLDFADVNHNIPLPSELLLYDSSYDADNEFTTSAPVPEPATMILLASGLVGLATIKRFRRG